MEILARDLLGGVHLLQAQSSSCTKVLAKLRTRRETLQYLADCLGISRVKVKRRLISDLWKAGHVAAGNRAACGKGLEHRNPEALVERWEYEGSRAREQCTELRVRNVPWQHDAVGEPHASDALPDDPGIRVCRAGEDQTEIEIRSPLAKLAECHQEHQMVLMRPEVRRVDEIALAHEPVPQERLRHVVLRCTRQPMSAEGMGDDACPGLR